MNEKMDSSSHPGLMIPEAHTNTNFNAGTNSDTFMTSNAPLTFLRRKSRFTGRYRYTLLSQTSLRNSLLPLAGFLELANAGDFAANVFNDVPVPAFAAALMGIGGCVALFFAVVAIYDAHLAWQNVCILRRERRTLHSLSSRPQYRQQSGTTNANADAEKEDLSTSTDVRTTARPRPPPPNAGLDQAQPHAFALRVYIDVNTFELGTEIIDRLMMDVTMGFGAVLVGVGTLMAIGGANHDVFLASNLLSGYIGNGPAALAGLLRAVWSAYVYHRASRHQRTARLAFAAKQTKVNLKGNGNRGSGSSESESKSDEEAPQRASRRRQSALRAYNRRYRMVKIYAVLAGPPSLVAGAASAITATRWWGYTLLAPCVALAWLCNWLFRRYVGYTRPIPIPLPVSVSSSDDDDEEEQRQSGPLLDILAQIDEDQLICHLTDAIETRQSLEAAETQTKKRTMTTSRKTETKTKIKTGLPLNHSNTVRPSTNDEPSNPNSHSKGSIEIETELEIEANTQPSSSPRAPSQNTRANDMSATSATRTSIFTFLTKLNLLEPFYLALLTLPTFGREKLQAATLDLHLCTDTDMDIARTEREQKEQQQQQQIPPTTQKNINSNSNSSSISISSPSPTITIDDPEHLLSNLLRIATSSTSTSSPSPSTSPSTSSFKTAHDGVAPVPAHVHNEKENENKIENKTEIDFDDITTIARSVLSSHGILHARHRERFIIEFLGCWIHHLHHQRHQPQQARHDQPFPKTTQKA